MPEDLILLHRAPRVPLGLPRPLPVLRPPQRPLPRGNAGMGPPRPGGPRPGPGLRGSRTAGTCTTGGPCPASPSTPTGLRGGDRGAPGPAGPRRLPGRGRALRGRGRAMAQLRRRHRPQRDVSRLLKRDQPNPVELFQIWLNLPAAQKMAGRIHHVLVRPAAAPGERRGQLHPGGRRPGRPAGPGPAQGQLRVQPPVRAADRLRRDTGQGQARPARGFGRGEPLRLPFRRVPGAGRQDLGGAPAAGAEGRPAWTWPAPTAPSCSSCRAGPSASPWPVTALL